MKKEFKYSVIVLCGVIGLAGLIFVVPLVIGNYNYIMNMEEPVLVTEEYGVITEIKSVSSGGFLSSTSCLVEINSSFDMVLSHGCEGARTGDVVLRYTVVNDLVGNITGYRIERIVG